LLWGLPERMCCQREVGGVYTTPIEPLMCSVAWEMLSAARRAPTGAYHPLKRERRSNCRQISSLQMLRTTTPKMLMHVLV
jgi:hypothetical protein